MTAHWQDGMQLVAQQFASKWVHFLFVGVHAKLLKIHRKFEATTKKKCSKRFRKILKNAELASKNFLPSFYLQQLWREREERKRDREAERARASQREVEKEREIGKKLNFLKSVTATIHLRYFLCALCSGLVFLWLFAVCLRVDCKVHFVCVCMCVHCIFASLIFTIVRKIMLFWLRPRMNSLIFMLLPIVFFCECVCVLRSAIPTLFTAP